MSQQFHELIFLEPVFHEKIWGGRELADDWGYKIPDGPIGECWAISAHPNGDCKVIGGTFDGKYLSEVWEGHREVFGAVPDGRGGEAEQFPLLIKILDAKDDPQRLKVVYNTLLGQLWEDRGDLEDEDTMLSRREDYGTRPDGTPVELPDGVLVLTCGVDTQDNRLEYEVVGHGKYGETWGIVKGYIMGRPDTPEVWQRLDDVVDHVYKFKNGRGLKISITCVDSGGHFTQEVYEACRARVGKRVFAIKGKGGDGIPFVSPPSKVPIRDNKRITCWLYTIGVDAGKATIMANLKVQEPGPKYCHFNRHPDAGYDLNFFNGLLSEKLVLTHTRRGDRWAWEKLPGHNRNEALDCRDYANAGLKIINPDMDAIERRLQGLEEKPKAPQQRRQRQRHNRADAFDDW